MKILYAVIIIIGILATFTSCLQKEVYEITREQADHVNDIGEGVIIARLGAAGPYKWVGAYGSPKGAGMTCKVTVEGQSIQQSFDGESNKYYSSQNFKNEAGDTYIILRRFEIEVSDSHPEH